MGHAVRRAVVSKGDSISALTESATRNRKRVRGKIITQVYDLQLWSVLQRKSTYGLFQGDTAQSPILGKPPGLTAALYPQPDPVRGVSRSMSQLAGSAKPRASPRSLVAESPARSSCLINVCGMALSLLPHVLPCTPLLHSGSVLGTVGSLNSFQSLGPPHPTLGSCLSCWLPKSTVRHGRVPYGVTEPRLFS